MQLNREELLSAYRTMSTIRAFEEQVHETFAQGEIPGFVHLYAGEEASAVGVCMNLGEHDYIASTHRGHGHCIAKGCDVKGMMAELYGSTNGLCHGKGGSMHIADMDKGMMGANGIVGGGPPLVCGAALSAKTLKTGGVAVAFFGDGGMNEGATMESMNLASVWKLPAIFVLEDNGYAESTASSWAIAGDVMERARGLGMPATRADGHDFFAVHEAAGEAVARARNGDGPSFIHVRLARYFGHFEGDATTYRGKGEVEALRESRDCLRRFRERVTGSEQLSDSELGQVDREVATLIETALEEAKNGPMPGEADLLTDVYASY